MHTQILCFMLELAAGWGFLFCLCLLSFVFPCLELTYPYSPLYRNLNTGLARWFKSLMDTVFNPQEPTQGKKRINPWKLSSDLVIYTVIQMLAPPHTHTYTQIDELKKKQNSNTDNALKTDPLSQSRQNTCSLCGPGP